VIEPRQSHLCQPSGASGAASSAFVYIILT
jgi:hypothetical protein